jgi:hypothetical protein
MVIKSPFKDYYDFIANQYGGGDPRIVYERRMIGGLSETVPSLIRVDLPTSLPLGSPEFYFGTYDWSRRRDVTKRGMYLVIAGKLYLISRDTSWGHDYDPNSYRLEPLDVVGGRYGWAYRDKDSPKFGQEYQSLIELSRKISAPVFAIRRIQGMWREQKSSVFICNRCPILKDIGVPSLITAFQMYQDLSYFMGNTMKVSPDINPPVEVSNKEKILKAGFDLSQSFRHRK